MLNIAAGNTDAHAKNFSLLLPSLAEAFQTPSVPRLADAYDLVPQVLFSAERDPLALWVNGHRDSGAVTALDLIAEGSSWGMSHARATEVVESALRDIRSAVGGIDDHHGAPPAVAALLIEQSDNLLRGDRAWTRTLPPPLALPH